MLAGHGEVGATVGLARDHSQLRDSRLGVRVEQFGSMPDDPAPLLYRSWEETGDVHESEQGDVEAVTHADEPCRLDARIDVQAAGEHLRLVGDDAYRAAGEPGEPDDDVLGVTGEQFHELSLVGQRGDDVPDVVGAVRVVWHDSREFRALALRVVGTCELRWFSHAVIGQE